MVLMKFQNVSYITHKRNIEASYGKCRNTFLWQCMSNNKLQNTVTFQWTSQLRIQFHKLSRVEDDEHYGPSSPRLFEYTVQTLVESVSTRWKQSWTRVPNERIRYQVVGCAEAAA